MSSVNLENIVDKIIGYQKWKYGFEFGISIFFLSLVAAIFLFSLDGTMEVFNLR